MSGRPFAQGPAAGPRSFPVSRTAFAGMKAAAWWFELLADAREMGRAAVLGIETPRDELAIFAGRVIRMDAHAFPVGPGHAAAESARRGFEVLARAFVTASRPEIRAALGLGMGAAALALTQLLDLETRDRAAVLARRTGERVDD